VLAIDWSFFYELAADRLPQSSRAIDTSLAAPLWKLPIAVSRERDALAALNLRRAVRLGVPAGPDVAQAMGEEPLSEEQLELDKARVPSDAIRAELLSSTPLWYYVLREAAALHGGQQLGRVGGRIVAEVLIGLLQCDPQSYLREQPTWKPTLPCDDDNFSMVDLVRFTLDD
jgi:hypothetical protein